MKNIKYFFTFTILFLCFNLQAHQQHTHQYLTIQGYQLLQRSLLLKYPIMLDRLGSFGGDIGERPWQIGRITTGAWREDEEDIVYNYRDWVNWDKALISITHFWDPDNGDFSNNIFQGTFGGAYFSIGPYPNAYEKMFKYAYPDRSWILKYFDGYHGHSSLFNKAGGGTVTITWFDQLGFEYSSLADLYLTGRAWIVGYYDSNGQWINSNLNPNLPYQVILGQGWRDTFVWEILGRMCHLLQDQAVPTHVHRDIHGSDDNGIRQDSYEKYFGYNFGWDYNSVYSQVGQYINPYISSNPLHYLMYITAQMSDHFGSNGPYEGDGNNIIGGNPTTEEISFLNSVNLSSLGIPTGLTNPLNDDQIFSIRNKMIPQAIRATAGLLYWFATEVGLASTPLTTCSININHQFEFDPLESEPQVGFIGVPTQISVQSPIPKNGKTYYFAGWSDDPYSSSPRTVTPTGNVTFTALYKIANKSNDLLAFSNNSQRKLIETKAGGVVWLHKVYTSMGHVWIEHSSNGGNSWIIGNNGQALNAAGGKNPSITQTNYSGFDFNYIGVVWQQQYGSTYKIMGKMFNQYTGSSNVPSPVTYISTLHTEPSDAYSMNANPNLVLNGGPLNPYFITFERKTSGGGKLPGINWLVGKIESGSGQMAGSFGPVGGTGIVSGTDANTLNTQMSQYPGSGDIAVDFIRQQGSPGKIYSHFLYLYPSGSNWVYTQIDDGMISYNAPVNFNPSIVSLANNYYSASWVEYSSMVYYYFGNPSVRNYYGSGVQSTSINRGGGSSSSGFAAWSQNPSTWSNKSIRFDNGSPAGSSISTLSTSNKYVQVGNGAGSDLSNMYVSSFNPFTSPYYFSTSGTLGPLSKENSEIVEGRGFIINKGDASFRYSFGDLSVDGKNIGFIDAPDALDYGKVEILNNALVTEPFQINTESKIVFTEASGFADSDASKTALGKDGYITFKIELINEGTGRVIGTVKNENLTSSNVYAFQTPSYTLNTTGLTGKTVRAKITLETNLIESVEPSPIPDGIPSEFITTRQSQKNRSNLVLTKSYTDKNDKLPKSSLIELALDASDIPLTYALAQNYPNPFNPSTVINYQIPENGLVTLKIYDILGKEVKTLVNEQKTSGRYEVKFDASDLASGIYIYKLQVNDFISSKKMMLLK